MKQYEIQLILSYYSGMINKEFSPSLKSMTNALDYVCDSILDAPTHFTPPTDLLNHQGMDQYNKCPVLNCAYTDRLNFSIIHLNDQHRWTREQIADWLDTLDNQPVSYPDLRTDDEKKLDAKFGMPISKEMFETIYGKEQYHVDGNTIWITYDPWGKGFTV